LRNSPQQLALANPIYAEIHRYPPANFIAASSFAAATRTATCTLKGIWEPVADSLAHARNDHLRLRDFIGPGIHEGWGTDPISHYLKKSTSGFISSFPSNATYINALGLTRTP
jgi:hypothetical protein